MPPSTHKHNRIQPTLPTNPRLRAIAGLLLQLHSNVPGAAHNVYSQRRILAALESLQLVDMVVDENHVIEYILRMNEEQDADDRRHVERMKAGMEGRKRKKGEYGVAVEERTDTEVGTKGRKSVSAVGEGKGLNEWEIVEVAECAGTGKNGMPSKGWMVTRLVKFMIGHEEKGE